MATRQISYPADSVAVTIGLASLGSSSTWVAGRESDAIVNTSNLDLTHLLSGKIRVGTSPTSGTQINIWVVPCLTLTSGSPTWPDVMDGSDSAETWTSVGIRDGAAILAASINVDATTTDRDYYFGGVDVAALCGSMPPAYVVFVAHNTGVNLNSTSGNHAIYYTRVRETVS